MQSLSTIPLLPREVYIAAGAVLVLLMFWIGARYSRHRYVVIRASEPVQTVAVQLSRIADAIDHLAASIEAKSAADENGKHADMSMLRR
jgi:hypothetical protein